MKLKLYLFFLLTIAHKRFVKAIFEGHDTNPHEFPNMVAITGSARESDSDLLFCGGIIYNAEWIATSGSCVANIDIIFPKDTLLVSAGKWLITGPEVFEQLRRVKAAIEHDYYNSTQIGNSVDLGLLKLSEPLELDTVVMPLPFSRDLDYPSGSVIIIGWGSRTWVEELTELPTQVLQYRNETVVNIDACRFAIRRILRNRNIPLTDHSFNSSHFCTGTFRHHRVGPTTGDLGGPVMKSVNGSYEVIGVISVGIKFPNLGIHVQTAPFLDWIEETVINYAEV